MKKSILLSSALAVIVPLAAQQGSQRQIAQVQVAACQSNLKSLATACEIYCTDNQGHYPKTLKQLTLRGPDGGYLKSIPTCPAAQTDTYSSTYVMKMPTFDKKSQYVAGIDHFRLCCGGHHHRLADYAANKPGYDCKLGLIRR